MAGEEHSTGGGTRQRRRTLAGAALIGALFGGALLIFFLDDIVRAFDRRYDIVVVMERAPGISEGSPVWIGGRQLGTITSIALLPRAPDRPARFAVALDLPRSAQAHVRADSDVRLTATSLIGEPVIDIAPGSADARTLAAGDTLHMQERLSAAALTARAGRVRAELDTTLATLRALAPPFRARLTDTRRALAAMDAAVTEGRTLAAQLRTSPGLALLRDPSFSAALDRTRGHASELSRTIDLWRGRTNADGAVAGAVARLQLRTDSLRAQLDGIAALLDEQAGLLPRLQRDSAIVRAIHAARADLDSLIAETRRNPLRYFF